MFIYIVERISIIFSPSVVAVCGMISIALFIPCQDDGAVFYNSPVAVRPCVYVLGTFRNTDMKICHHGISP